MALRNYSNNNNIIKIKKTFIQEHYDNKGNHFVFNIMEDYGKAKFYKIMDDIHFLFILEKKNIFYFKN